MAKKPTITSVTAGYQGTATINNNLTNLRDAFDNTLSLDGSTPNGMLADFDVNNNDIINAKNIYADDILIDGVSFQGVLSGAYNLLLPGLGLDFTDNSSMTVSSGGTGITDGDKGDITVSSSGAVWTINASAVSYSMLDSTVTSAFALTSHTHSASDITSGTLPVARGGTNLTTAPSNGQILIGNGTGYALNTITAGANVTITNTAGGISISAATTGGSTLANGDYGDIIVSSSGTVMLLDTNINLTGTPTAASAAAYTNTTQIATTANVYNTVTTVPENAQTGTTYTLVLADAGKLVSLNNASAITLTIPTNASVAFPVNTRIDLLQYGAGQVTVGGAGVTIRSSGAKLKLTGQYSGATLWKKGTDEWVLIGDIAT